MWRSPSQQCASAAIAGEGLFFLGVKRPSFCRFRSAQSHFSYIPPSNDVRTNDGRSTWTSTQKIVTP